MRYVSQNLIRSINKLINRHTKSSFTSRQQRIQWVKVIHEIVSTSENLVSNTSRLQVLTMNFFS